MKGWNDKGIYIEMFNRSVDPVCNYQAIYLFYVLEGKVDLVVGTNRFGMNKGDVVLVNPGKQHRISADGTPLVCRIMINYAMLLEETGKDYALFWCNSLRSRDISYDKLRYILDRLLMEYAANYEYPTLAFRSIFMRLLDILIREFMIQGREKWDDDNNIGEQMVVYLNRNYRQPMTLEMLAQKFYLSLSTCSRMLKNRTGMNFNRYLNQVRLQYAVEDIVFTDKNMTMIAVDHGFATQSSFNRAFREYYHMTPTEYREKYGGAEAREIPFPDKNIEREFNQYLENLKFEEKAQEKMVIRVCTDVRNIQDYDKPANVCVNFGMASDLLSGQIQKQLDGLKKDLGIRYIRIANPFGEEMHLKQSRNLQFMNFDKTDMVLDAIVDGGFHPWLDLGNKPKQSMKNVHEFIFYKKDFHPAEKLSEWRMLLERFFEHVKGRYGEGEVSNWIFEFWCDDQFPIVGNEDKPGYADMWQVTWECVRRYAPKAKIGGIGYGAGFHLQIARDMLVLWKDSKMRPDFLSIYAYPYERQGTSMDLIARRQVNKDFLKEELARYRALMKEVQYPDTPIYVTEWSTSLSDRNYYNDSYMKAAHMAYHINTIQGMTPVAAYWNGSDMLGQYFDTGKPFAGALGLVNKDGMKKPAYFVLEYMNRLGKYLLGKGKQYIITSNGENDYYMLLFHPQNFSHMYYIKDENDFSIEEQETLYEPAKNLLVQINLDHIRDGEYTVKQKMLGEDTGNVFGEWKKMGCVSELSREDIAYLEQISVPHISVSRQKAENGRLSIDFELLESEICFCHIYQY